MGKVIYLEGLRSTLVYEDISQILLKFRGGHGDLRLISSLKCDGRVKTAKVGALYRVFLGEEGFAFLERHFLDVMFINSNAELDGVENVIGQIQARYLLLGERIEDEPVLYDARGNKVNMHKKRVGLCRGLEIQLAPIYLEPKPFTLVNEKINISPEEAKKITTDLQRRFDG